MITTKLVRTVDVLEVASTLKGLTLDDLRRFVDQVADLPGDLGFRIHTRNGEIMALSATLAIEVSE